MNIRDQDDGERQRFLNSLKSKIFILEALLCFPLPLESGVILGNALNIGWDSISDLHKMIFAVF